MAGNSRMRAESSPPEEPDTKKVMRAEAPISRSADGVQAGELGWMAIRLEQLSTANADLQRDNARLLYENTHDELTGALNRRGAKTAFERLTSDPSRTIIFLYVDGTDIKKINDTIGHDAGDDAIRATANILASLRENDAVARVGGDEFIALLDITPRPDKADQELTTEQRLATVQERVSEMAAFYRTQQPELAGSSFDVSVGAFVVEPGMTFEEATTIAETKMTEHKRTQHQERGGAYRP